MRVLLVLSAFGLVSGQDYGRVTSYQDTFGVAPGVPAVQQVPSFEVNTGPNAYATANAATDRADERDGRQPTGQSYNSFRAALDQLITLLKEQKDGAEESLATEESNFDKTKCSLEKTIKSNEAKEADQKKRLDTATAQYAKWDAEEKQFQGQQQAELTALTATGAPIIQACASWYDSVCNGADSMLEKLQQNIADASLMYAALQKLAERRAEFNYGGTLGLMQLTADQIEKIELTDDDIQELSNIKGVTSMLQGQIKAKLKIAGNGAGAGGVYGAIKGLYDTVVTNAQNLVKEMNEHGVFGDADELNDLSAADCAQDSLGGTSCPTEGSGQNAQVWTTLKPLGRDTFSALMRTTLAQRRAHASKYQFIVTSTNDAMSRRDMWASKESDASDKLDSATQTAAIAKRDLQQLRSAHDVDVKDWQDLLSGLHQAITVISDPSIVQSTVGDAPAFIQIPEPVGLIQTSMAKARVDLMQKTELAVQADGFSNVITSIQAMIPQIHVQIQDEKDRTLWCTNAKNSADETKTDIHDDVDQLTTNANNMNTDIGTYENDIANWEAHAKDIEELFNDNMDTCERDLTAAQKEKNDAEVNERMYSKINGILLNLKLATSVKKSLLCGSGSPATWQCGNQKGVVTVLMDEVRQIQNDESVRMENMHKWCNGARDIYSANIRNAKANLAKQNVLLATTREEARKNDEQLSHANQAYTSAEDYLNDIEAQCNGLIGGTQTRAGEWTKEIAALTSIIEMLSNAATQT